MAFIFGKSFLINSLARVMAKECNNISSEEGARNFIIENDIATTILDGSDIGSAPDLGDVEVEGDYDSPVNVVYRYLGAIDHVNSDECHHLQIMNDRMKELNYLSDQLTAFSAAPDYDSICKEGIKEFKSFGGSKPTKRIVDTLSSSESRISLLRRISSKFIAEYIGYWDAVLCGYKRKSARANRIQYLIEQITLFEVGQSYLGPNAIPDLSEYKRRLSEALETC